MIEATATRDLYGSSWARPCRQSEGEEQRPALMGARYAHAGGGLPGEWGRARGTGCRLTPAWCPWVADRDRLARPATGHPDRPSNANPRHQCLPPHEPGARCALPAIPTGPICWFGRMTCSVPTRTIATGAACAQGRAPEKSRWLPRSKAGRSPLADSEAPPLSARAYLRQAFESLRREIEEIRNRGASAAGDAYRLPLAERELWIVEAELAALERFRDAPLPSSSQEPGKGKPGMDEPLQRRIVRP